MISLKCWLTVSLTPSVFSSLVVRSLGNLLHQSRRGTPAPSVIEMARVTHQGSSLVASRTLASISGMLRTMFLAWL